MVLNALMDVVDSFAFYLDDLKDGFLVGWQAGKGIFAEALSEGTELQQTLRIDLQQKEMVMRNPIQQM